MTLQSISTADTFSGQVAREIRMHLARLGHNQAALARALDVGPMWVSDRLSGKVQIGANDLPRFAEALGVNVVDLLPRAQREVTAWYPTVASAPVPAIAARISTPVPRLRRTAPTGA